MTGGLAKTLVAALLTCAACGNGDSPATPRPGVADALVRPAPPDAPAIAPDLAPDRQVDLPYNWVGAPDASGREVFSTGTPYAFPDGGIRTIAPDAPLADVAVRSDAARDSVAADVAPACRRETETCLRSSECCPGVICQRGRCVPCGDGVCGPGESRETCCRDCPCGAGTYCSPTTLACLAPVVLMSFTFTHACVTEPGPIEMRLFDDSNGLVFPGGTDRYILPKDGTETFTIQCVPGDRICFGAAGASGRGSWGAGLAGNQSCTGCCAPCGFGDNALSLVCR